MYAIQRPFGEKRALFSLTDVFDNGIGFRSPIIGNAQTRRSGLAG